MASSNHLSSKPVQVVHGRHECVEVPKKISSEMNITVLGAGVQGLTTSILLQVQGHKVTIVSKGSPDDWVYNETAVLGDSTPAQPATLNGKSTPYDPLFTSPKAGANWQSFAEPGDLRLQGKALRKC
jgi:hypothetical protein